MSQWSQRNVVRIEVTVDNGRNTIIPLASTVIVTTLALTSWIVNQILISGTIFDLKVKSMLR